MPIQRRLPKVGFTSAKKRLSAEVRLSELTSLAGEAITLVRLIEAGTVPVYTKRVKVIQSGEISVAVKLIGIFATSGATKAIEAAGGSVE